MIRLPVRWLVMVGLVVTPLVWAGTQVGTDSKDVPMLRVEADPLRGQIDRACAVIAKLAKKYDAHLVDAQAVFDRLLAQRHSLQLSADRIHPYFAGHMALAEAWLAAVDPTKRG